MKIENHISIDQDTQKVTVTVTRRDYSQHQATFDLSSWQLISNHHWHLHETRHRSGQFYLATRVNGRVEFAHRLLLKPFLTAATPYVDHVSGDTLHNCLDNLRVVSHQENCQNRMKSRNRHTVPTRPTYPNLGSIGQTVRDQAIRTGKIEELMTEMSEAINSYSGMERDVAVKVVEKFLGSDVSVIAQPLLMRIIYEKSAAA